MEWLIGLICGAAINGLTLAMAVASTIQHTSGDAGRLLAIMAGFPVLLFLNLSAIVSFDNGGNRWFALGAFVGLVAVTIAFAALIFR